MKITANYEGLIQIENGDYVFEGNLISENSLEIELDDRLVVKGSIIAKTYIKAGCGIKAGEGIEAKSIYSKKRIFAGISTYRNSDDCIKTIKCEKLLSGEIAYGELIIIESEEK